MKRLNLPAVGVLMILLAACAGSTSSESAGESEAASDPTAEPSVEASTEASIEASESAVAAPSIAEGAGDLASLLPTEIGGLTLQYTHAEGEEVFGTEGMTPEGQAFLDQVGAEPGDISTAFGFAFDPEGQTGVSIVAFRVEGRDEATLRTAFLDAIEAEGTPAGEETTVAGKDVTAVGFEGATEGYLYANDDVVFLVSGEPAELAEEALEALP